MLSCLIALAATLVVAIQYPEIRGHHGDEVATTLLLAATGFVGLALGRAGEDAMAAELLFPLRVLAVIPVLLAITAALVVVYQPTADAGQLILIVIAALIAGSAVPLARNWYVAWKASEVK